MTNSISLFPTEDRQTLRTEKLKVDFRFSSYSCYLEIQNNSKELNIELDEESFNTSFETLKKIADRKGEIVESELLAIVGQVSTHSAPVKLISVSVNSKDAYASATVTLNVEGEEKTESSEGDGMIDAAFTAVKTILNSDAKLIDYKVDSITKGSDSTAEIVTIVNDGHNLKQGRAVSTDVVQGSVESFLNALNK